MEKFFNIKCRASGLIPQCVVLVATVRALKMHGGGPAVEAGRPLADEYVKENIKLVDQGCLNMQHHIRNATKFGLPVVVSINRFKNDTAHELDLVRQRALQAGAADAVVANHWEKGGAGILDLAKAVEKACRQSRPQNFRFLYPLNATIKQKIETIAKEIYGAREVTFSDKAEKQILAYNKLGFDQLPICMAKTHLSLSCDPNQKGVPKDFIVPVREIRASVGAGFLYPLLGKMSTMPGLPTRPAIYDIDIDPQTAKISGLF